VNGYTPTSESLYVRPTVQNIMDVLDVLTLPAVLSSSSVQDVLDAF
jgi:hypothetical protein